MDLNHLLYLLTTAAAPVLVRLEPLWYLLAALLTLKIVIAIYTRRRFRRAGINRIDTMSGLEFEQRLAIMFRRLGYRVTHIGKTGDFGGDLVLSKDGVRTVVQAKRWQHRVGVKAVQEAVAAKNMYNCTRAMVVTNSDFTGAAQTLAVANDVELLDRAQLVRMLLAAH